MNHSPIETSTGSALGPGQAHHYLTTREAAVFLRCSKSYLDKLRVSGGGPIYLKPSGGKVLYKRVDLIAWMDSRRCRATNDYG